MKLQNKLISVILIAFLLIAISVYGYMHFSNYSFVDALYMVIITMSTVGFGEVHPLSPTEKIFTILLIITSIGIFGYLVSLLTEFIADGKFLKELKTKKMQKKLNKLENHTIVCGYGRNGRQSVKKLKANNVDAVVIESDEKLIEELDKDNILHIKGDATNDLYLEKAGVSKASNLITALPSDADNLYVVLSARQLNPDLTIISRASKDTSERKLRVAGADNIIMPDRIGGDHMASLVVLPDIIEFVDKLTSDSNCQTNLKEVEVDKLPSHYLNKTLLDLNLRKKTGCSVVGFKTPANEYQINPEPTTKLISGSKLIVLGRKEQIQKLKEIF
ncbi:MAG TPA: potassium channel protein [Flavobacteriia bacterium]|jgi:voltage-gated potassium channel|nr:potassium channel protein [Flavobacteriia bacterium]